jgi:hypothetical protein
MSMPEAEIKSRKDLMCPVERIGYDAGNKLGWLNLPEGCSANGEGVIRLFTDIDPEVNRILVFSGPILEFIYSRKKRGKWTVSEPK